MKSKVKEKDCKECKEISKPKEKTKLEAPVMDATPSPVVQTLEFKQYPKLTPGPFPPPLEEKKEKKSIVDRFFDWLGAK